MSSSEVLFLLVIGGLLFLLIWAMFRKPKKRDHGGAGTSHNPFWGDGGSDGGDGGGGGGGD